MILREWFKQTNPKWEEYVRRFLSTSCACCFIEVSGWKADKDGDDWRSMHVGAISAANERWRMSLKGRCTLAWRALRGWSTRDLDFDTRAEVNDFIQHLQEVRDEVWPLHIDTPQEGDKS